MNIQTLVKDENIEWTDLGGGIRRKIMAYDEKMMIVKIAFEAGGMGAIHKHIHTQASYINSGKFEITIGENKKVLSGGDVYFVPANIEHGAVCIEEGILIDVFHPLREDFID